MVGALQARGFPGNVTTPVSDIDLLRIQTELLSHIDGQGRIVSLCGLRINTAWDGRLIWFGDQVPDQLPDDLRRLIEAQPLEADPTPHPGPCVTAAACSNRWRDRCTFPRGRRSSLRPTFVSPPMEIVRSVEPKKIASLRDLNPETGR